MTSITDPSGRAAVAERGDVSRETLERLDALISHMETWQRRLNLMGPREFARIWSRHIDDSLQLIPLMGEAKTILDLGSGGGFPGLVIAAALGPSVHVTLVESVGKKCAFLSAAIDELNLSARVINERVEAIEAFPADCVTARAFAPMPKLLEYAAPWLRNGAFGLFHKGKSWQEEIEAASRTWAFRQEIFESRTDPAAIIVKVSEVRRHG